MKKNITLIPLILLITGSIDSIRNLPATALFGSTLIFFFILSAILFLIPTGLVAAELSSALPDKPGIYQWVKLAFGEKIAVLAIWLQWINTMVWYPTILSFIAGTVAYLINPALANNKVYLISIILAVFWIMTLINLKGLHISAKFASICAFVGMVIPMALIIILAIVWLLQGHHTQITINWHTAIPHLGHSNSWISLTAIMAAFLGMELAAVHVNQVKNPQKTFPKALLISIFSILITMILGSLAIAFVLPSNQINLVDGVMQAFDNFFQAYHLSWLLPVIGVMILIGSVGGMVNWIISPAKGLLQAAENGYLPKVFAKSNKHGAAQPVLLAQAILVSLMCLAFLLMPSVNGSYWLLTDLSTELYIMMYMLMFLAAITIKLKMHYQTAVFMIPGGKAGLITACLSGLIGCTLTFVIGFFPPSGINVGSALHYHVVFSVGLITMILPIFLFYLYKKKHRV